MDATIKQGETRRLPAPVNARSLRFWGEGGNETVEVSDSVAVLPAAITTKLREGRYASEWTVVDPDTNDTTLPDGPVFEVVASGQHQRDVALTQNERILQAARKALETASGSSEITIDVQGFSASYTSRQELVTFVNTMEQRVARERGHPPIKGRRLSQWLR